MPSLLKWQCMWEVPVWQMKSMIKRNQELRSYYQNARTNVITTMAARQQEKEQVQNNENILYLMTMTILVVDTFTYDGKILVATANVK